MVNLVVSTVISGILFARFPTVECLTTIFSFLLLIVQYCFILLFTVFSLSFLMSQNKKLINFRSKWYDSWLAQGLVPDYSGIQIVTVFELSASHVTFLTVLILKIFGPVFKSCGPKMSKSKQKVEWLCRHCCAHLVGGWGN